MIPYLPLTEDCDSDKQALTPFNQADGGEWATLSDTLESTMVRKKNLARGTKHLAKARAFTG